MVFNLTKKKPNLKVCKKCKQPTKRVSRKGYCPDCSVFLATDAITQLQVKKGKVYDKWHANVIKGMKEADQKKM